MEFLAALTGRFIAFTATFRDIDVNKRHDDVCEFGVNNTSQDVGRDHLFNLPTTKGLASRT